MERDLFCLICRENYGEFLPECKHRYHLECLYEWFRKQKMECPLCRGPISEVQFLEDLIAKRMTPGPWFKADSFKKPDEQVLKWVIEYKITHVMTEILKKGVDLVIPAFKLGQMDFFKEFLENELRNNSTDNAYVTNVKVQLKVVEFLLKTRPKYIHASVCLAGEDGNLDIIKYFLDISDHYYPQSLANNAALNGHFAIVKYLVEKKLDTNQTAIFAIRGGHIIILKYLIRKKMLFDLDPLLEEAVTLENREIIKYIAVDLGFASPVEIVKAATMGNFEMVKYFTEMGQACPYEAIEGAASKGHLEIAKYLIMHGRNSCTLELVDNAASKGYTELVKYLVQIGKPYSYAAFESGYKQGNLDIVKCLIEDGHPCSSEALDFSAEHGYVKIVKYLVKKGKSCTWMAIDGAASGGHYEIVKCLLQDGRLCSSKAVVEAAKAGHLEIVTYLLESAKRFTDAAFVEATSNGNFASKRLKNGRYLQGMGNRCAPKASCERVKQCSTEAIDGAASAGHFEIVQLLIEYGNKFTLNAIKGAADNGHLQMIQFLMLYEDSFIHV